MVPQAGVEPTLANYLLHTGYKSAVLPLNYRGIAHSGCLESCLLIVRGQEHCSSKVYDKTHSGTSVKTSLAPAAIMCLNVLYHPDFTTALSPQLHPRLRPFGKFECCRSLVPHRTLLPLSFC